MPTGGALRDDVIAALAKSIDEMQPVPKAAEKHDPHLDWLLHKPVAPPFPVVQNTRWVRNPIDAFVLAKLESKGMQPAPPASKRAWLRRVYFDLFGLPPTPEDIEAFESDHSPDAHWKIVYHL